MTMILATIHLTVDAKEDEFKIKEEIEYALNTACSQLERSLTHESIHYKIRRLEEI